MSQLKMMRAMQAVEFAKVLHAVSRRFPFASERDRSAWLAGLLTVKFRHRIDGPVPMFWIFGDAGTEKTLLADHTVRTATGEEPIHVASTARPETLEVLVRRQKPMVIIDDVQRPLSERVLGSLCMLITAQTVHCLKPLSKRATAFSNSTVFWATGPVTDQAGELMRRVIPIHLSSSTLGQHHGPVGSLLCARLLEEADIMLSYSYLVNAGADRESVQPFESFPEWSEQIREPLVWCGLPDPLPVENRG